MNGFKCVKRIMSYLLICALLCGNIVNVPYLTVDKVYAADGDDYIVEWERTSSIDEQLNKKSSGGDNDIFLKLDLYNDKNNKDKNGKYQIEYFLEDNMRTVVDISKSEDTIDIAYNVYDIRATTTSSITAQLIDKYYTEMDYEQFKPVEYPDKETNSEGAIEFTIEDANNNKYKGFEFNLDQRRVVVKWNTSDDELYYFMDHYERGNIMPVTVTDPNGESESLNILKSLEDFKVSPTQYQNLPLQDAINTADPFEYAPVVYPKPSDEPLREELQPGDRPGIDIEFNQPKIFDMTTYAYTNEGTDFSDYEARINLNEFGESHIVDLDFNLGDIDYPTNSEIRSGNWDSENNAGAMVVFENGKYRLRIVQDKSIFTDENDRKEMVEWSILEASTVYHINVVVEPITEQPKVEMERTDYKPDTIYAYTYLDYELIRSGIEEAFLRITPYNVGEDEEVAYTILTSNQTSTLTNQHTWLTHNYLNTSGATEINIPVPFYPTSDRNNYQVLVDYKGNQFGSQILKYDATKDNYVETTTPQIREIKNVYAIPSEDPNAVDPFVKKIQFDLVWDAPSSEEFDAIYKRDPDAVVYYELMVNSYPHSTEEKDFKIIKIFEVYNAGDATNPIPALREYTGGPDDIFGEPNPYNNADPNEPYSKGYNIKDGLLRMNDIVIYDENADSDEMPTGWINVVDSNIANGSGAEETQTPYKFNYENDLNDNGVNYLKMSAITKIGTNYGISPTRSLPMSLTLADIVKEIPVPDGLDYNAKLDETIDVGFKAVDTDDYERYMLLPVERRIGDVDYRMLITHDKTAFDDQIPGDLSNDDKYIHITEYNGEYNDGTVTLGDENREILRHGINGSSKVIYIDIDGSSGNAQVLTSFKDLDANGTYYVMVQTVVHEEDDVSDEDIHENEIVKVSNLSDLIEITNPSQPDEPEKDEIAPIAVDNLEVKFKEDSKIEVEVDWDYADEIKFEEGLFGFEVIALEDLKLASTLKANNISIEDIIKDTSLESQMVEGFRIYVTGSGETKAYHIMKYINGSWQEIDEELYLDPTNGHIQILDVENSYNKVYYYYARTIKLNPEEEIDTEEWMLSRSSWTGTTLTTEPVNGPINLQAWYDSEYNEDDDFNPLYNGIVSFDAPIPYSENIGSGYNYDVEIYIKGDDDDDYTMHTYETDRIGKSDDGDNGYTRFYYIIGDSKDEDEQLKSGSSYKVKVRLIDNSNENEALNGDKSKFSNIAVVRTEFSQEDYEKEEAYNKYVEIYKDKAADILYQPYYVVESTSTKNIIKYRDDYGISHMQVEANGTYDIGTKDVKYNKIFLPSQYVEALNDYGVNINMTIKNNGIIIRKKSIGVEFTDVIQDKIDDFREDSTDDEDYYIVIEVTSDSGVYFTDKNRIGDSLSLEIGLVGSEITEEMLDVEIIAEHAEVVEDNAKDLDEEIREDLEDGVDEEELLKTVERQVEETIEDLGEEIEDLMDDYVDDSLKHVYKVNKKMQIRFENTTGEPASTYMKDGVWTEVESTSFGNQFYIDTDNVEEYALAEWKGVSDAMEGVYSDDEINVIKDYSLDEILGKNLINNPKGNYYYQRLVRASASALGYKGDYDECLDYLEELGLEVPLQGENTYVKRDKAMILLTQVYCEANQISIERYNITDYNMIQDLDSVHEDYHKILLVGAALELFELDNGYIDTDRYGTVEELVTIFGKID